MGLSEHDASIKKGSKELFDSTKRTDRLEKVNEFGRQFIGSDNKLKEGTTRERKCIICKQNESSVILAKDGFNYVKCRNCGMVYVNPVLKEEVLDKAYGESDYADS